MKNGYDNEEGKIKPSDLAPLISAFANAGELEEYTGKSGGTILKRLKHLSDLDIIKQNGRLRDPQHSYSIKVNTVGKELVSLASKW